MTIFDPPLPPYQRLIKWGGGTGKRQVFGRPSAATPPTPPPEGGGVGGVPAGGDKIRSILERVGGFKNGHYIKKNHISTYVLRPSTSSNNKKQELLINRNYNMI